MINKMLYRAQDVEDLRFYQMPKILFESEKYKKMSNDAKVMYSLLRDRQDLSIKNNWLDEEGYIYSIYTVTNLMDIMNMSNKTIVKYKQELKKYGLIMEKKQGQGKPNRLYIVRPTYEESVENIENTKTCNIYTSRSVNITPLEVKNLHPNDTDISDTEFNDTQSVSLSNNSINIEIEEPKKEEVKKDKKTRPTEAKEILTNLDFERIKVINSKEPEIVDYIENTLTEMINIDELTVNKVKKDKDTVIKTLKKLKEKDINNLIENLKTTKGIRNKKAYVIVSLYNTGDETGLGFGTKEKPRGEKKNPYKTKFHLSESRVSKYTKEELEDFMFNRDDD